jgi:hypothetical protein
MTVHVGNIPHHQVAMKAQEIRDDEIRKFGRSRKTGQHDFTANQIKERLSIT